MPDVMLSYVCNVMLFVMLFLRNVVCKMLFECQNWMPEICPLFFFSRLCSDWRVRSARGVSLLGNSRSAIAFGTRHTNNSTGPLSLAVRCACVVRLRSGEEYGVRSLIRFCFQLFFWHFFLSHFPLSGLVINWWCSLDFFFHHQTLLRLFYFLS